MGAQLINWINKRVKVRIILPVSGISLFLWPYFLSTLPCSGKPVSAAPQTCSRLKTFTFVDDPYAQDILLHEVFPHGLRALSSQLSWSSCPPLLLSMKIITIWLYIFTGFLYWNVSSKKTGALLCFLLFYQHLELCLAHNRCLTTVCFWRRWESIRIWSSRTAFLHIVKKYYWEVGIKHRKSEAEQEVSDSRRRRGDSNRGKPRNSWGRDPLMLRR